ncbi:hypothetical protein SBRY_30188 [Actinacidiphila bryophytorum]|uniref:Uncharacterized protein n=1 Tax=Actinacidiphila bryophytorum TaxID=1436133 RepID=A0A9W4H0K4_9ACTN|nr:hypothetical protein SBRY_30188 [Actinacidiphila bryophytorum]
MASGTSSTVLMLLQEQNCCGPEGIRTPDPLDANEVRYRTAPQALATRKTLAPRHGWS